MKLICPLNFSVTILALLSVQAHLNEGGAPSSEGLRGKIDSGDDGHPDGDESGGKPDSGHGIPGLPDGPIQSDDTGFLDMIKDYGCWCKFGKDTLRGVGKPVDYIDKLCYDLTMCLRCPKIHHVDVAADRCISTPYNTVNTMSQDFVDQLGVEEKCQEINTHPCGVHNCICYSNFAAGFFEILKHPAKIVKLALIKSKYEEHFDKCEAENDAESDSVDIFGCPEPEEEQEEETTCSEDAFIPPEDDVILKKITIKFSCFKPAKFESGEKKPIAVTTNSKPKNPIKYFDQDVKPATKPEYCEDNMFYNVKEQSIISKGGAKESFCVTVDSTLGEANDAGIQEALTFFRPCKSNAAQTFLWKAERFIQTRDDGLFSCLSFNKASKTKKLLTMFVGADKASVYKLCTGKFMVDKFVPLVEDEDTEEKPIMKMDDSTDSIESADMDHMDHTMIEEKCGTTCGNDDICYETCLKHHFQDNNKYCLFHCGGDRCCREQCSNVKPVKPKPPAVGKPGRPGRPGVEKPIDEEEEMHIMHKECMMTCIDNFKNPTEVSEERAINNIKVLTKVAKVQAMEQCLEKCDQEMEDMKPSGDETINETPSPNNGNMEPKPNQIRQLGNRILGGK